jgi:hypothetical protein
MYIVLSVIVAKWTSSLLDFPEQVGPYTKLHLPLIISSRMPAANYLYYFYVTLISYSASQCKLKSLIFRFIAGTGFILNGPVMS